MAWRIDEHVVRGELDNRERGRVIGRIWFAGRAEPVELQLTGNCWRDLAGRRLEFTNPDPKPGLGGDLAALQRGVVGDITASRKVKVPEIPLDQIGEYYAAKKPFPWHWGNSLHLEWHSERNGRVVIESATFELKIVGEPAWEMSEAEEAAQRRANGEAVMRFLEHLSGAAPSADANASESADASDDTSAANDEFDAGEDGDEFETAKKKRKPLTEAEADALDARSELLNDRIQARLDREGDDVDLERIIEEEIDRLRRERGEPEFDALELVELEDAFEGTAFSAEEILENARLEIRAGRKHPLAERAKKLTTRLLHEPPQRGWIKESDSEEHPLSELISAVMKAGGKLAGALNGREWPPPIEFCANVLVRLKKARAYLEDALAAHDDCVAQHLAEPTWLAEIRSEAAAILAEVETDIAELRARLKAAGAE